MFKTVKIFIIFLAVLLSLPAGAYEDCIVTNTGKLTDIKVEDNTLIDVYPIITVMNEKNTLIVHPLKEGRTRFCVLKNGKNIAIFEVTVMELETHINAPEGFEVFTLDTPGNEFKFKLDKPPVNINYGANKI